MFPREWQNWNDRASANRRGAISQRFTSDDILFSPQGLGGFGLCFVLCSSAASKIQITGSEAIKTNNSGGQNEYPSLQEQRISASLEEGFWWIFA
jgi:hypothetical protein